LLERWAREELKEESEEVLELERDGGEARGKKKARR
jgi:hypothetical protein